LGTVRGDANLDGKVDAMDLNQVGLNWRMTRCVTWEDGDFTGDGLVAAGDLNAIGVNWLHGVSPEAPPLRAPRAPLAAMAHPPKATVDSIFAVDLFFAAVDNSLPDTAAMEELSIDITQASEQSVHSKEHRACGYLRGRNYTATLATDKSEVNPADIDGLFASLAADIRFSRIL
jgi:hypothetical protein